MNPVDSDLDAPITQAFEQSIPAILNEISILARALLNNVLKKHHLTPTQWLILSELYRKDCRTQTDLAHTLLREKPSIGKSLDVLVRTGWVMREADKKDRRTNRIYLTQKTKEAKSELEKSILDAISNIENEIPETDLVLMRKTLRTMALNLKKTI